LRAAFGDPLQFKKKVAGGLPAILGILCKADANGAVERWGCEGLQGADWFGVFLQNRGGHAQLALARESTLAGEHFVEDRAERKDVAARVEFPGFDLLGRHVLEGANDGALLGHGGGSRDGGGERCSRSKWERGFCEAEIEELRTGFRDHDVAGLQIAMNDALAMGLIEGIGD